MKQRLRESLERTLREIPLSVGLGLVALAMSFSLTESIKLTAIITLFVWSGRGVVRLLVPISLGSYFELALAILFSSLVSTLLFQFARTTEFREPLTVSALILLGVLGALRESRSVNRLDMGKQLDFIAMAMLVRGLQGATWLLGCSVVLYLFRRALNHVTDAPRPKGLLWLGISIVLPGSFLLREIQRWWWYPSSNDAQFFEAMSKSLSIFGPFEHPGVLGNSLMGYHWFVYGWSGVITELVDAKKWNALTIYVPFLLSVIAIALIKALFAHFESNGIEWIQNVATTSVVLVAPTFALSSWFGNLWILAILVAALALPRYELQSAPMLVLLLGIGAAFAKGTNVVLLPVVGVVTWLAMKPTSQRSASKHNLVALVTASAVGAVYYTSGIGSDFVSSNRTICDFDQFLRCTRESVVQRLEPILFAGLLIWFAWTQRAIARSKSLIMAGSYFSIILIITVALSPVSGDFVNYLIYSLEFVVFAILIVVMSESVQEMSGGGQRLCELKMAVGTTFVVGIVGSLGEFVSATLAGRRFIGAYLGGQLERLVVDIYPAYWKITVSLLILLAVMAFGKRIVSKVDGLRGLVGAVLAVSFATGLGIGESSARYWIGADAFTKSEDNSAPMATDDLVAVGIFVARTTARDYVLATNNFCCTGSGWVKFEVDEVLADPQKASQSWSTKFGGANYLVAAETQRRTLVSGLRFVVSGQINEDVVKKLKASVDFANSPTVQKMMELCHFGADGAVINLKLADLELWDGPGTVEFASGNFVFINFRECNS